MASARGKNGGFGGEEGSSNAIFLHLSGKNPGHAAYDNVAGAGLRYFFCYITICAIKFMVINNFFFKACFYRVHP